MKLKIAVGVSLVIFFTAIIAIMTAGLVSKNNQSNASANVSNQSGTKLTGDIKLTQAEISKHDNINDCWMIIDNKVYDVTQELSNHPGGVNAMLPYCGKDGTQGFATKDRSRSQSHSNMANSLLANYFLGDVNQTVNQSDLLRK